MKVVLADDQAMVRGALATLLRLEDMEVIEAATGEEAIEACSAGDIDVAILDIEMPGMGGIEAAKIISATTTVLIVTTFGRPGYLKRALSAGASGFVVKETPAEELATAVRSVAAGGRVIDPKLATESLFEGDNPLSEREREILAHALTGATAGDIAKKVFLSEGTVRNHLSSAIQKTETSTRLQAARYAEERGWL